MSQAASQPLGHILLVDDEQMVRNSLSRLLASRGFKCTDVGTGADAIAALREHEFDALVADIQMPDSDGLTIAEHALAISPGLPVILFTGHPSVETAARSVRLAVVAYLTKPADLNELCTLLSDAIAAYRAFRIVQTGRHRLRTWESELEHILALRKAPQELPGGPLGSYLRLTLQQVILMLSDLETATQALEQHHAGLAHLVEHEAALRRAVDVLRRTKQNFKSRELAELRQQLERVLSRSEPAGATDGPDAN